MPISDVWSHNRMLETCRLANIAIRLGREREWNRTTREIVGDYLGAERTRSKQPSQTTTRGRSTV